ncbi:lysine--tRNA ligase [Spiroplasma endosymbiont of Calodromius spilotus]|uniref:lysine--tRNA ligase n=1 Tax=Spiroplasma endosymbiont of Calodromius spilotus TaxID=3077929 RepID=UPI0031FED4DB
MSRKFSEQEVVRRDKLEQLVKANHNPFAISKVERTHTTAEFKEQYDVYSKEQLQGKPDVITIAGRIRALRTAGKAIFANVQDQDGQIQVYLRLDEVSKEEFLAFEQLDLGDIISVTGGAMKTQVGELTLRLVAFQLLSKALKPFPNKHDGLKDTEERYRRRYVDLIVNEEVKAVFIKRTQILNLIRQYLQTRDYLEVETPVLQPILGGATAKPFKTHHNTLDMPFYLRVAPELYLKKLLVGGFEKVFEMGRLFRNEGMSAKHNPEFTAIEIYVAYQDMNFMMQLTEDLISYLVKAILPSSEITYDHQKINFRQWNKMSMVEAIKNVSGVEFNREMTLVQARKLAKEHNIILEKHQHTIGHIINAFFEQLVEKTLIQPSFIYGYPLEVSPLAKKSCSDERFTDRFELFIGGREYANGYSELNDPIDQYNRFEQQLALRNLGDEEANEMDLDFVEALEYGMPPAGGLGIGIDRLVMLLTEQSSIKDVLLFPHMRIKE